MRVESAYDPFVEIGAKKVLEQALLAVIPEYRGMGIGALMAKVIKIFFLL